MSRNRFVRFLGIDLGGGKGKKTALACLRTTDTGVAVERLCPRNGEGPLYDAALVHGIRAYDAETTVVAVNAPLSLPPCLRCRVTVCPGVDACVDPAVVAMQRIAQGLAPLSRDERRGKPHVTPYTQRATELYLRQQYGIEPREALGQGTGPLAARAAHLLRTICDRFTLNDNLIEVFPKATLALRGLAGEARRYKRHLLERQTRAQILDALAPTLSFAPGVWREECVQSDHAFDAVVCAYTAFLWASEAWQVPAQYAELADSDGWIWASPQVVGAATAQERDRAEPDTPPA